MTIIQYALLPGQTDQEAAMLQLRLLPHVQASSRPVLIAELSSTKGPPRNGKCLTKAHEAEGMCVLGTIYYNLGRLGEAERMFKLPLQRREDAFGPNHIITLYSLTVLGCIFSDVNKLDDAERICKQAFLRSEKMLGLRHEVTLKAVIGLANTYKKQGKPDTAEAMLEIVVEQHEHVHGPKYSYTLDAMESLGLLYLNQKKLGDAEEILKRTVEGLKDALGPNDSSTLSAMANLGFTYSKQNRPGDAERLYERVLQRFEDTYGAEVVSTHAVALTAMANLGSLLSTSNKSRAKALCNRALSGLTALEGASSERYQALRQTLAELEGSGPSIEDNDPSTLKKRKRFSDPVER